MRPGSFHGTRTKGTVSVVEIACSICTRLASSTGPCCMSTVRLSHPACAITSAEKELGTCNHPFTTVPPSRQMLFRRFSLILVSPLGRLHASSSVASLSRGRLEQRRLVYQARRLRYQHSCNGLRGGLPRRAAPVAKFEALIISCLRQPVSRTPPTLVPRPDPCCSTCNRRVVRRISLYRPSSRLPTN